MKTYKIGDTYFYESSDLTSSREDYQDSLERHIPAITRLFTKRRLFRELTEIFGQVGGLEGKLLLRAHGVSDKDGRWIFYDDGQNYLMQDWINQMDGIVSVIMLEVCNPEHQQIHSSKSVVIHPRDNIDIMKLVNGGELRIYVPREGYLDTHYKLRKVFDSLTGSTRS